MKIAVDSHRDPRTRIDTWLKALRIQAGTLEDLAGKITDAGDTEDSQRTCDFLIATRAQNE
jgi:hypothetical protein